MMMTVSPQPHPFLIHHTFAVRSTSPLIHPSYHSHINSRGFSRLNQPRGCAFKARLLPGPSISLAKRALEEMAVGNNLFPWHDSEALMLTAVERDSISRGLLSSFSLSELECIFRAQRRSW